MAKLCERAVRASRDLATTSASDRTRALRANALDMQAAVGASLAPALQDRLLLDARMPADPVPIVVTEHSRIPVITYGSHHTEAIVTADSAAAERFMAVVHSSTVIVNASTRFADGAELGLGAKIGISTSKLHANGPMGTEGLTTVKDVVNGNGQVRI